jgi:hypothetical protein
VKASGSGSGVWRHGLKVALLTFCLSLLLGLFSSVVVRRVPLFLAFLVLLAIIALGIVFDIMGVAVTAAEEPPLHAMSAKRTPGARQAIRLLRRAPAVSNFCNDVVGDIAGTLSGATGATIVFYLIRRYPFLQEDVVSLIMIATVSALTVGGKAVSKHFSIAKAGWITFQMGKVFAFWERILGRELLATKNNRRR